MPRQPRIHAPGLLYHVICRGNQRQPIFLDEQDHRAYLHRLAETRLIYRFRLYSYVLMPNHVHMLIEVDTTPLSMIMQILQQRYTQHFNRKYGKVGHLFQARFKAIICDKESYLLELVRYIHLNPVRSKLVADPSDYPWSSHRAYLAAKCDDWLDRDAILMQFSRKKEDARRKYADFILGSLNSGHRDDLYDLKEQQILGDDEFVDSLPLGASSETSEITSKSLIELADVICDVLKIDQNAMRIRRDRTAVLARALLWIEAKRFGYQQTGVASFLGCEASMLSQAANRILKRLCIEPELADIKNQIVSRLST